MFIGHFAAGLIASRAQKRLPLGTSLFAAQLPDVLWPYFLLTGAEVVAIAPGDTAMTPLRFESYPWSHSLLMVAIWGALLTVAYVAAGRPRSAALLLAPLAISHWFLDFITHRPDMPLVPWSGPKLGLGMWNSVELTVVVEGLIFGGAVAYYTLGREVKHGFWVLIGTMAIAYVANVLGPPPPGVAPVAASMIVLMPLVWWWGNKVGVRESAH